MHKTKSGFTIVELLIVIVVIAILAAITIVAYNGIQARATFTKQVAEVDRIGKAIQLWSAANGKSLSQSGSGYQGQGQGFFSTTGVDYPTPSLENRLRESGYLTGSLDVNTGYMLAICTNSSDTKWAVLAILDPAPPISVSEQISKSGCTYPTVATYADPAGSYRRNFIKAY